MSQPLGARQAISRIHSSIIPCIIIDIIIIIIIIYIMKIVISIVITISSISNDDSYMFPVVRLGVHLDHFKIDR